MNAPRTLGIAGTGILVLFFAAGAVTAQQFDDLGPALPLFGESSNLAYLSPANLSDGGEILAGTSSATDLNADNNPSGNQAFIWSCATGAIGLGSVPVPGAESIYQVLGSTASGLSADGGTAFGFCDYQYPDPGAPGTEQVTQVGFVWTPADGMQSLGYIAGDPSHGVTTFPMAISADGSVVTGESTDNLALHAFRWTKATGIWGLGTPPADASAGTAISADGSVITGTYLYGPSLLTGDLFQWTQATGITHIPLPAGDTYPTEAFASADGSVVVGISRPDSSGQANHVFRWTQATGAAVLPFLPGDDLAFGLSTTPDASVIVGWSTSASGTAPLHGFRWSVDSGLQTLGTLPGQQGDTIPSGVSADGRVIVGGAGGEAFIWTVDWGIWPLKDILECLGTGDPLPGWTLISATAISADGRVITGLGVNPDGQPSAWRVVLGQEP